MIIPNHHFPKIVILAGGIRYVKNCWSKFLKDLWYPPDASTRRPLYTSISIVIFVIFALVLHWIYDFYLTSSSKIVENQQQSAKIGRTSSKINQISSKIIENQPQSSNNWRNIIKNQPKFVDNRWKSTTIIKNQLNIIKHQPSFVENRRKWTTIIKKRSNISKNQPNFVTFVENQPQS